MANRTLPFHRRHVLLLIALGLAITAQYLFTGEWLTRANESNGWIWPLEYTIASVALVLAIVCSGWAVMARHAPLAISEIPIALPKRSYPIVIGATVCYLLSSLIYLISGENGIVQFLWVASGCVLAIGLWRTAPPSSLQTETSLEFGTVVALTFIGSILRFWKLGELPAHIDNDIPWVGTVALQLIANGDYSWLGMNSEAIHLQSYPQFYAWSMRLFGEDLFGLIVTSAIAGTLTLPVVYALGREMFHPRVGLIAMALLAINYTHIHFSRTMFGPKVTLCATLAMYMLFRGLRRREPVWFALGGLSAGVGLLLYDSSRVIPVVCLGVLVWFLVWQRDQVRANLWGIILFGLGMFVGFGPMLSFALTHFDLFLGRGNDVMIWSPGVWKHAVSVYGVSTMPEVLFNQATRTFLTFHLYGDSSPQFTFTRPMVRALTAAFLVVGTGVLLFRLRDIRAVGLLMWVGLTLLIGGILTYDPPFWPHLNIALPAVMLIAAVGVHTCTEFDFIH